MNDIEQTAKELAADGFIYGAAQAVHQRMTPEVLIYIACREVARQGQNVTAETVFAHMTETMQSLILLAHAGGPLPETVKVEL